MTPCPHTSDARNCWHCRPRPAAFDVGPLEDSLPAADREPDGHSYFMDGHDEPGACHDCGGHLECSGCNECFDCRRPVCLTCRATLHHLDGDSFCLLGHDDAAPEMESNEGRA